MKKVNKEISDEIMKYVINSDFYNLRNITNELYIKGNFSNETKEMLFDIINKFDKTSIKENKRIVIPVKKSLMKIVFFQYLRKRKRK